MALRVSSRPSVSPRCRLGCCQRGQKVQIRDVMRRKRVATMDGALEFGRQAAYGSTGQYTASLQTGRCQLVWGGPERFHGSVLVSADDVNVDLAPVRIGADESGR